MDIQNNLFNNLTLRNKVMVALLDAEKPTITEVKAILGLQGTIGLKTLNLIFPELKFTEAHLYDGRAKRYLVIKNRVKEYYAKRT